MTADAKDQVPDQFLLDVPDVAKRTRLGSGTVRQLIRDGRLRHVRVGRRVLVPVDAVWEFIAASEGTAARS